MNVFLIGGTGLLGSAAAQIFLDRGHSVKSVALPPLPQGAPIPQAMELSFGNYLEMSDEDLAAQMAGCDCFVFAAGVDERVEFPPPVYEAYERYNIKPLERMIPIAKAAGATRIVVLGSYFSYFAKEYPSMRLCEQHPYIRSRIAQEETALAFADETTSVAVLELPYIFGTQPGRKPVWAILIEQLAAMPKGMTMYPKGGTAMLTVRQVAETIVGAAERNKGANAYPISYYNLSWDDFLTIVHAAMGVPKRKILHIPHWMFKLWGGKMGKDALAKGYEMGIDPSGLADIMCMNTFIDNGWAKDLGATDDDIKSAIFDSVKLSVDAFQGKQELVEMKAE
ncbi:MAG: NAD-dependent epimerase/dehydratase family protein [Oscillospiraceae bacterium]|jgi:nucleoside-diphosphate-sugar epimerase|nr:NAD-dependent epimerase/dehydratase family protein [Oscillospiraceae bacterium]